jgi:gliding motility-associated-like protein
VVALVVKSDHGCIDTLLKVVHVSEDYGIYVPSVFTPNADGLNDVFQPKGFGISKYEISIFDRWGEMVFTTKEFTQGWDGTIKGRQAKLASDGSYVWQIKLTNVFGEAKEITGHVILMK